jgi:transposase
MATRAQVREYTTVTVGIGCLLQQIMQRLEIVPILDGVLRHQPNVPTTYGTLAQVILINRLSLDPQPLYALGTWAAEHGIDHLLNLRAEWLDDDRLGALLDGIADHQVTIWSKVLGNAGKHFPFDLAQLHADTTSIYFTGRYQEEDGTPKGGGARIPRLLKGYNKDGKPHHLQMVLSLITSGHTPLWFCPWNGNQPDNGVYVPDVTALRQTLLLPENALLIGDRKLTSEANIGALCRQRQRFLAPHAWTPSVKGAWRQMEARLAAGEVAWQPVAYERRRDTNKPAEKRPVYRVLEEARVWVDGECGAVYGLRWIWVWSSQQAEQDVAHRDKALAAGERELQRMARLVGKYGYKRAGVITARIERALRRVHAQEYYSYTLTGCEEKQDWQLSWERKAAVIVEDQRFDGVSLLVTNAPASDLDAENALIKYKGQSGMEQTIDFIKSPVEIRPMWVHNPRRVAALTLLIMIAVMIAGLIEAEVRRWIAQTGCLIGGLVPEGRDNAYPTARRLLRAFQEYTLVIAHHEDGSECLHYPRLNPVQQQIWEILKLLPLPTQTPLGG